MEALKERYIAMFGLEPAPSGAIQSLEQQLSIRLPEDFRAISEFCNGGFLGGISLYSAELDPENQSHQILGETLRLRDAIGLPRDMIVLAEPPASLIVMRCGEKEGTVIWLDATDAEHLANLEELRQPETWTSYRSFFEHLLDEEEEEHEAEENL